ncbi:MAG TPA: nuclear transport factor 2 family protein [Solirubrobacteraceae bacterium]|nr:nuclear transport factor 2 family protein [Solirubrobacteraceae bacterium]
MSPRNVETVQRLYRAITDPDLAELLEVLDPNLHADFTVGLPQGWGGTYTTAADLIERCWRPMFSRLAIHPVPQEYILCESDQIVVLGRYQGQSRATGRTLDAAFAHVLQFEHDRIIRLVQITDSARWHEALR